MEKRNSQLEHGQPMGKQEACFARETRLWLAANHNTSVTSGECVRCSKRTARAGELGRCQSNMCNS